MYKTAHSICYLNVSNLFVLYHLDYFIYLFILCILYTKIYIKQIFIFTFTKIYQNI